MSNFHVEVNADDLLAMATASIGIVESKQSIPELSSVMLTASTDPDGGKLWCEAYDLEIALRTSKPCTVKKEGSVCVPGKALRDMAKTLEGIVTIKADKRALVIEYDGGKFQIPFLSADSFPSVPKSKSMKWESAKAPQFAAVIGHVRHAMKTELADRPFAAGMCIDPQKDFVWVTATDAHRVARSAMAADAFPLKSKIVLPFKAVQAALALASDVGEGTFDVAMKDNNFACRSADTEIIARLLDLNYPAIEEAIPADVESECIEIKSSDLTLAVQRALMLSDDGRIALTHDDGRITAQGQDSNARKSESSARCVGDKKFRAGVQGRYVLDALAALDCETVKLQCAGELSPLVFRPKGNANIVEVIAALDPSMM